MTCAARTDPTRWQTGYDFPAVRDGRVVKETFPTGCRSSPPTFVFNTRRPIFADIRVRQAIALLFDFEWINRNFFFGLYRRSASFFDDSELSAYHRPADERERALLAPFPDAVRARRARRHLVAAGHRRLRPRPRDAAPGARPCSQPPATSSSGTTLRDRASGRPFAFEIMVTNRDEERLALAFSNDAGARRHRRAGAAGRRRAIRAAPARRSIST